MRTITNPSLTLKFFGNDLKPEHSTTQTVTKADIVFNSIKFTYNLLNNLMPSSKTITLQLQRKCHSIEDIIATEGDISVILKDGTESFLPGICQPTSIG